MEGSIKGSATLVCRNAILLLCELTILHRELLVSKISRKELKEVLSEIIEIVKFHWNSCIEVYNFWVDVQGYGFSTRVITIANRSKMAVKRKGDLPY